MLAPVPTHTCGLHKEMFPQLFDWHVLCGLKNSSLSYCHYVWFICEVNDDFGDVKVHMMYEQLWLTFSVNECVIICNKFVRSLCKPEIWWIYFIVCDNGILKFKFLWKTVKFK
jgi:hypothetical protein